VITWNLKYVSIFIHCYIFVICFSLFSPDKYIDKNTNIVTCNINVLKWIDSIFYWFYKFSMCVWKDYMLSFLNIGISMFLLDLINFDIQIFWILINGCVLCRSLKRVKSLNRMCHLKNFPQSSQVLFHMF
jgi:hypothetical protein